MKNSIYDNKLGQFAIPYAPEFVQPFLNTIASDDFITSFAKEAEINEQTQSELAEIIKKYRKLFWICVSDFVIEEMTGEDSKRAIDLHIKTEQALFNQFRAALKRILSEKQVKLFQERTLQTASGADYNTLGFYFLDSLNITNVQVKEFQACNELTLTACWHYEQRLQKADENEKEKMENEIKAVQSKIRLRMSRILNSKQIRMLDQLDTAIPEYIQKIRRETR